MLEYSDQQRKKKVYNEFLGVVPKILSDYGLLLAKYPMAFIDESQLPVSKRFLKEALKQGWNAAKNDEDRDRIVEKWAQLKYFQPDVGGVPISATSPDQFSSNALDEGDRWANLKRLCEAEEEVNNRERLRYFGRPD
jgi:hypothetical protein